ncbi:MAG TPA: pyridoxamine 5'-phosphate oxidase family protein [Cellvibrio sp.]|nr:pyridoxamine 5'-phosphate oxidase family protein [Cellvibrio sp.]
MSAATHNSIQHLREKIQSIRIGMLTTLNRDMSLSSRPMTQQQLEEDGTLWFFVSDQMQLTEDIDSFPKINVTFANPADSVYVTASGNAEIVKDREKAKALWNPMVAVWFPGGLDDPHLALIKFNIHYAEYWDAHSNTMMQLFAIAKAAVVGERPKDTGEHEKIEF